MSDEPPFSCPRCGAASYHPTDAAEGYCGRCHDWTRTDDRDPTYMTGHAREATEHEVASPSAPGQPTGPAQQADLQGEPTTSPRPPQVVHLAWLMWCFQEGYKTAEDRSIMENWMGEHQDNAEDETTRQALLEMATEILAVWRSERG